MPPTADSSRDRVPQPRLLSQQELSRSVSLSLKLRSGTEASTPATQEQALPLSAATTEQRGPLKV